VRPRFAILSLAALGIASCGDQHGPPVACAAIYRFAGVSFPVAQFTTSGTEVSVKACVDRHCSTVDSSPAANAKMIPTGIVDPPHHAGWRTARLTVWSGHRVIYRGQARIRVRHIHNGGGPCPSRDFYVAKLSIDASGRLVQTG
jgi:hypothetical protein